MKSKEKSKEEIVLIRYYNVLFYLVFKGGIDDFNRQCLVNRINTGESIRMKQIQKWCHYHQITYRTRFIYRKDFPLKANLWNLYSYIRFLLENREKISDIMMWLLHVPCCPFFNQHPFFNQMTGKIFYAKIEL